MDRGYSCANAGLSWIEPSKFKNFSFLDKDLSGAGLKKYIPWMAEYFQAFHCSSCRMVLVDYSRKFDRKTVNSQPLATDH